MPLNSSERRTQYINAANQLLTYCSEPSITPRTHRDFNPLYEDQDFVNLFNWFPNIQALPEDEITVVTSYEFAQNTGWG